MPTASGQLEKKMTPTFETFIIAWLVGALICAEGTFLFAQFGSRIKTDDWTFFLSVFILSSIWPVYVPSVLIRRALKAK